ncbi:phage minor head protein [uncultured Enterobacter sp.]|uniref:phage minor head protein n=1 Tax=uncultured Enterobacter sp. TaxID=238202 RepID=UPI00266FD3E8|nr:phage minor head protein [uncultured Enterobacter sp.]
MARTVNYRLQDETIAHGLYVNRYGTGVARRMVALLSKLDSELAAKLMVLLDGKRADTYSARRLASLLAGVRDLNQQAYESVNTALARELTRYVEYESGYQMDLFSSVIPQQILKHVPLQSIAPEQVYAGAVAQPFQGRLLKEWGKKLETDRLDKITNAVRSGFLQGETVEQIVKRVAGTPQRNREDGVINTARRDLAVVTRTAVNHMAATARQEFAQANSDIVKAKQWSSTLDTHTSQWCIIRDRKLYTLDGKPLGHVVPYLRGPGKIHFCCRSSEILITKSWEELQIPLGELSNATRASMDGQVPAHTSYAEWLTRQPYARQEQVLGVTRAMMLRDGKITVPEMFNDAGEFLTLDELRRVDASAFG